MLQIDEKHIIIPCNTELRIFSVDTRPPLPSENSKEQENSGEDVFDARMEFKQSMSSASIMILRESEYHWVGITYDGEVLVVEKQSVDEIKENGTFNLLAQFHTHHQYVRHGDVSLDGETIAFISEYLEDNSLVIIKFDGENLLFFEEIREIPKTIIKQCEFDSENNIILACAIYEMDNSGEKPKQKILSHALYKYGQVSENYDIEEKIHIEDGSSRLRFKSSPDHRYGCIMFHSRRVAIIDFETLLVLHEHVIEGIGFVICDFFDRFTNSFIVAHSKDTLISYKISNSRKSVKMTEVILGFTLPDCVYH